MPVLTEDVRLQLQLCIMALMLLFFNVGQRRIQDEDGDTS